MPWLARRIGVAILLVWAVASIVFLAIRLVPGDPAELLLSQGGVAPDPATVAELREQLGLDRPIVTQYLGNFARLLSGDLGRSLQDGSPVGPRDRPPPAAHARTDRLRGALLAVLVGMPGGLFAAVGRHGTLDRFATCCPASRSRCRCSWSARCWCCCSRRSCAGCRRAATSTRHRPTRPLHAGGDARHHHRTRPCRHRVPHDPRRRAGRGAARLHPHGARQGRGTGGVSCFITCCATR